MANFIPDGTRVSCAEQPDKEIPEQFGIVYHDLGGENVPVYIDGKNNPSMPHDYTSVPRVTVTVLPAEKEDDDDVDPAEPHAYDEELTHDMNSGCVHCGKSWRDEIHIRVPDEWPHFETDGTSNE